MGRSLEQQITWHEIGGDGSERPDMDLEVMVYDEHLDDVVLACLTAVIDADEECVWVEATSGDTLPAAKWWAEKPYPED